jgi:hypothetical protein
MGEADFQISNLSIQTSKGSPSYQLVTAKNHHTSNSSNRLEILEASDAAKGRYRENN